MKRIMTTLAVMVMVFTSAAAMSFSRARKEALFLTDKMAYELNLSSAQFDAVYEINLDYLLALDGPADLDGIFWMRRNSDLRYVLSAWQWELYLEITDFYRPMYWISGARFSLYLRSRYPHSHHFFFDRPAIYGTYHGGHNHGPHSFYADRHYGAPTVPSYTHVNGTGRMGGNGGQRGGSPGYTIGNQPHQGGQPGGHQSQNGGHQGGYQPQNSGHQNSGYQPPVNPNTSRGTVTNEGRTTSVTPSTSGRGRSEGSGRTVSTSSSSRSSGSSAGRSGNVGTTRSSGGSVSSGSSRGGGGSSRGGGRGGR